MRERPPTADHSSMSIRVVAGAAALALASGAAASTPDLDLNLVIPGLTGALAEDALSPRENPAGLGFLEGGELRLVYLRAPGARSTGLHWGTSLGPLAAGFGREWLGGEEIGDERRSVLTFALGDRDMSLGGSVRWLRLPGADERNVSYDVGIAGRTFPFFAWSLRARDIGFEERLSYSTGIGLRFLRDRVTLGLDRVWASGENFLRRDGLLSAALQLRIVDGFSLTGHVLQPLADDDEQDTWVQAAVTVDLPNIGFSGGHIPRSGASDNLYLGMRLSTARHRTPVITKGQVKINLERALSPDVSLLFAAEQRDPFLDLLRLIDQARRDPEIGGMVLRTSGMARLSFSEVEELRRSFELLRVAGKTVYVFLDGADDWTLYLASAADRVIAAPSATFAANGLAATVTFIGEGLGKIGVNPQFARAGRYKTAPDALERSDISDEQQEALDLLLDDTWNRYRLLASEGLGMEPEAFEEALARGLYSAQAALEAGLVDQIAFPDEIPSLLLGDGERPLLIEDYGERVYADRRWGRPPTVAVVPITGTIVQGETPRGLFATSGVTGAETAARAIRRAIEDPRVASIVLRIDSPGGEAHASDLIRRAAAEADQTKPVIASMSSVAASGGYYVAVGARHIVATPSTITGSIGVFAGAVDLSGLFEMLGINQVTLKRGELADIFTLERPWTEEERAAFQTYVDEAYEQFVADVAQARGMSTQQVREVAQGRVWTGAQARVHGLLDETGTFQDAVERAKSEAGIRPAQVVDVSLFTGVNGPLAAFTGRGRPLAAGLMGEREIPPMLEQVLEALGPFRYLNPHTPLALVPYDIELR